jgi:hypothetical protein
MEMTGDYDYYVLGEGNPFHPANFPDREYVSAKFQIQGGEIKTKLFMVKELEKNGFSVTYEDPRNIYYTISTDEMESIEDIIENIGLIVYMHMDEDVEFEIICIQEFE